MPTLCVGDIYLLEAVFLGPRSVDEIVCAFILQMIAHKTLLYD